MGKARIVVGLLPAAGVLLAMGPCDWFYGLLGNPPAAVLVANSDDGTVILIRTTDRTVIRTIGPDDPFIDPPEPSDVAISPATPSLESLTGSKRPCRTFLTKPSMCR